jgi:chorismate mutase
MQQPASIHDSIPRDLSDPSQGPHVLQRLLQRVIGALERRWRCRAVLQQESRGSATDAGRPLPPELDPGLVRLELSDGDGALLLVRAGLVRRREKIGHVQLDWVHEADIWLLRRGGTALGTREMAEMIALVCRAIGPGLTISATSAAREHLRESRDFDVRVRGSWVRLGACGLVDASAAGGALPDGWSGLGLRLSLDRAALVVKGIDDVRLLRSQDPVVASQMVELGPYVNLAGWDEAPARTDPREASAGGPAPGPSPRLEEVRARIDEVDRRIVKLVAERRRFALAAAELKGRAPMRAPAREDEVLAHVRALAGQEGLEADVVEELYRDMMAAFVRIEERHTSTSSTTCQPSAGPSLGMADAR